MNRLLVIRLGALGDLIHASASLQAVKAAYPEMALHLLTSPAYRELAGLLPGVDHVWCWDKRAGWPGLLALAKQLRLAGFNGVVNLHPSFKSWLLIRLISPAMVMPIPHAVYRKQKLKVKGAAQRPLPRRHAVSDFYEPFRDLLTLPDGLPGLPFLSVEKAVKPEGERWIGLIPGVGAQRSNRAWEPEGYVGLIHKLLTLPNVKLLLIGGPDEQALAAQLLASVPESLVGRVVNHCGAHDIPGTASLLAACELVIGGDTGPMHLAGAVGVPLVGLYGPTAIARTGPVGNQFIQTVLPPDSLACWPCEAPTCPLQGAHHLACMKEITVAQVWDACQRLLASNA